MLPAITVSFCRASVPRSAHPDGRRQIADLQAATWTSASPRCKLVQWGEAGKGTDEPGSEDLQINSEGPFAVGRSKANWPFAWK
jgi:hypothetical protein